MPVIGPTTVLVRSPQPLATRIHDEIVVLDVDQGCYFGLDRSGSAIWDLLETPRSVEEVCAGLVERFDVSRETCRSEVVFFLHELHAAGLVQTVAGAG